MKSEPYNNYLLKTTHHTKFHFDLTRWVVLYRLSDTQFALLAFFFVFLSFGLFVTRTGRTGGPTLTIYMSYDVFPP